MNAFVSSPVGRNARPTAQDQCHVEALAYSGNLSWRAAGWALAFDATCGFLQRFIP